MGVSFGGQGERTVGMVRNVSVRTGVGGAVRRVEPETVHVEAVVYLVVIYIQTTYKHPPAAHRRDACMPRLVLPRPTLPSVYTIHS